MKTSQPSFPYYERRAPSQSKTDQSLLSVTTLHQGESLLASHHNNQRAMEAVRATMTDLSKVRAECWKLYDFVKLAWPHVPALNHVEFVPGWHIAYICEHLEAISKGILDGGAGSA
jgi:hypothetical protein